VQPKEARVPEPVPLQPQRELQRLAHLGAGACAKVCAREAPRAR
jgi:hypothetical protein